MRALLVVFICIVIGVLVFVFHKPSVVPVQEQTIRVTPTLRLSDNKKEIKRESLFVPYWSIPQKNSEGISSYDEFLYFGILPSEDGISTSESGYTNISTFTQNIPEGKQKWLVVRLLDDTFVSKALENATYAQQLRSETIRIAKENHFSGILVDLEVSALPFQSVIDSITQFHRLFSEENKKAGLSYGVTLYGDSTYRARPYDFYQLSTFSDRVFVMAYDLHKPHGDPGPNFPLQGKNEYGYDLETMMRDFESIPPEKMTIIFGMFGYNWQVDEQGKPKQTAIAQTNAVIIKQFIDSCIVSDCIVRRDSLSAETQITYTDQTGNKRIIWFEDTESVKKKEEFLEKKGIHSFSFWIHGYF